MMGVYSASARAAVAVALAILAYAIPATASAAFYCENPPFRFALTDPAYTYETGYTIKAGATCNKRAKSEISERFTKLILQEDPKHGSVKLHKDGSFDYTAHANYHGADAYMVRLCIGDVTKPGASQCADLRYRVTIE